MACFCYILVWILLHLWQKQKQWIYVHQQQKIVCLLKKLNALLHDHRDNALRIE